MERHRGRVLRAVVGLQHFRGARVERLSAARRQVLVERLADLVMGKLVLTVRQPVEQFALHSVGQARGGLVESRLRDAGNVRGGEASA